MSYIYDLWKVCLLINPKIQLESCFSMIKIKLNYDQELCSWFQVGLFCFASILLRARKGEKKMK